MITKRKQHDEINKLLFSEPRMMEDLLKGFFIDAPWSGDLDFSTLERVNSSFISSQLGLKKRDSDMIWRIRLQTRWIYLLVIVEFQSTVDPFMAVRFLTYRSLLYEEIIKNNKKMLEGGYLPPILSMVLYNGSGKWTASCSFRGLLNPNLPEGLLKYQPEFEYWLLEEGKAKLDDELSGSDNLVSILVQFEQAKTRTEMSLLTKRLIKVFNALPGAESLKSAFTEYLTSSLKIKEILPDCRLDDIKGVNQMLSETVDSWIQDGFKQGIHQGMTLGERALLERLINKKFGKLSPAQKEKLNSMTAKQLLEVSDKILSASSIEDILGEMTVAML